MTESVAPPTLPDRVFVQFESSSEPRQAATTGGGWSVGGAQVNVVDDLGVISVRVSSTVPISRVGMRWDLVVPAHSLVLGDAWERSYGDLQWRHLQPERVLPWYWLAHDEKSLRTLGRGVMVRPGSLCSWTVDEHGYTLWLDVRCGGAPVELGDRQLLAARIVGIDSKAGAWAALEALTSLMADSLLQSPGPIVGANNWYYAYGRGFNEEAVLGDARTIVELADGHPVRPFSVVDDGWNPGGPPSYGPWNGTPGQFDDLARTASAIRDVGARPGIWFRPLASLEHARFALPGPKRPGPEFALDPSIAGVLDQVEEDVAKFRDWGFELLKHDFSTWDVLGRWGPRMGAELTDSGWAFNDRSRTTAEILIALYERIRVAAGSAIILGCNVVGHLAAGLIDIQRTGDDTSGRAWERTRRMGINTLAFRLPQHDRFFTVDADCVPCTPQTEWSLNRQFLDLVARSGTALFVSIDPHSRTEAIDRDLSSGIRLALDGGDEGGIRPINWLHSTSPTLWASGPETIEYNWDVSYGTSPFEV